ncbi:MAG: lasso peptide isopeptide bond-forming cyclase [Pelatocladus maniniholoensis HA4357-MV3]|jgi:asparagine synthase (glutamine-hydrolysing)|uniref:asparagine synthase (glutamine-hydrolyzing) n=1 Tax=Pelatocladus maniniholoensis HA4357-MV3 TaxID=1117104 RepID=A0A9E3LSI4_9NOST|nr:lasso peptide isopeptide bond-forming cyclase [Pelatocladus maniniholoensis HA4357-MV3]BAZ65658.1 putative asparagine synthase [Fischerella sp. NIES-4106]
MSGIMGIYHPNHHPVDREDLGLMLEVLAHRGLDGTDIWVNGAVGFAHRMLWTTPESLIEKLPLVNKTSDIIITSDARIDNRDELLKILQFDHLPHDKITDSQIILAAYEKWGEECSEHLLGDFAFAIWDQRQQILFCSRDHFGVKPFYYYHQLGQAFIFASEIKALFCLQQVPRQINEVRIADFLALMMEDKAITTYQDILRLPPAHSMVVSHSGIRSWCYWTLDPHREIKLDSDEAYAEEFRKIFTEAVRCRMRSAFPIGSHLSGGLDSSSITCVVRELLAQQGDTQLHTFSNIFDEVTECDERTYINAVLEQGGLIPHYVKADQFGPLSDIKEIWQYEDEALLGPSHFYPWRLNQAAKQAGVRIVFDGLDGDTTVCHGVPRLRELAHQGKWSTFVAEAQGVAQNLEASPQSLLKAYGIAELQKQARQFRWLTFAFAVNQIHHSFNISRKYLLVNYGLKSLIPKSIRQLWQRWRGRTPSKSPLAPLVNSSFAQRIGLDERILALDNSNQPPLTTREQHWRDLSQGIFPYILEQLDRYAAPFSLEARHPFLDKRLVEFCLALPAEQKLSQGLGRMVMRRALIGILPEAVRWRGGKANMTSNFMHGMLTLHRQLLDEVISDHLKAIEEYIEPDYLQAAYRRMISEQKVSEENTMTVWQAIVLALWFRHRQPTP